MSKAQSIPEKVDAFRFAENGICLQGVLSIECMQRLSEYVNATEATIEINLEFGIDEEKLPFVKGDFATILMLQCQRCMASFSYPLTGKFYFGIAHTEEESQKFSKDYDFLVAKNGILLIQDVVEDEMILNLPIVPMHQSEECKVVLPLVIDSVAEETEKENPFKVIELLHSKNNSNKS